MGRVWIYPFIQFFSFLFGILAEDMKCDYHPKNIIKDGQVVLCCYTSALIDNDMKHLICNKNNETFLHISANHLGNKQKKSPKYEVNKDEIKRGYIYITINNFNESDFGKYCCIIKFPESFRQNCGEGDVIIQDNSEQDQERCTKSDALITSSTCEVVQECNRNRNNNKASLADPQNNSTKEKRNLSAATILCIVLLLILF
ncbi:uncharacterized protein LOC120536748 [Polypterus senegalus]|uniref:uncharacterized protein LOC120536748 n=1 Tax=Polypterus senegalus TaxID=55291 RepID=UPI001963886E|nr:uncharacterized protein LOC120536748 [Polypterus senegalus]